MPRLRSMQTHTTEKKTVHLLLDAPTIYQDCKKCNVGQKLLVAMAISTIVATNECGSIEDFGIRLCEFNIHL